MKIDLMDIDHALEYYQINSIEYKEKCYQCAKDLNSKKDFNRKSEEIYHILYTDPLKIATLWNRQNMVELFGTQYHPYITNVLVLLGWKIHEKNMIYKKYTQEHKRLYQKRVTEALTKDIYDKKLEGIRISQMIWATYFIHTKLIEVGRLQYEKCENSIKIHIPSGDKLEIQKVLKSLQDSKTEIEIYFNLKNPEYYCNSWILSNQIHTLIDSTSNIAKFYQLFEVEDGPDAKKDIFNFVFSIQECNDYHTLDETTTLQKLLKQQLLENKELRIGCGKLKNEILGIICNFVNARHYRDRRKNRWKNTN